LTHSFESGTRCDVSGTSSKERLRQILHEEVVSFQAVKTWKESKKPKFKEKLKRLRELTNRKHNPPTVVAADEMRSNPT